MLIFTAMMLAMSALLNGRAVQANIVPRAENGLILLNSTRHDNGILDFYGISASGMPAIPALKVAAANCGDNNPIECDLRENLAIMDLCHHLIDSMIKSYNIVLNDFYRSVCWWDGIRGPNFQCCASWPGAIPGLKYGYLINGILDATGKCVNPPSRPYLSAMVHNARLADVCTTQCVSNRPNGCACWGQPGCDTNPPPAPVGWTGL
jgi:hypothetical protein